MVKVWQPEHPHHAVWQEYTQSLLDGKPKAVEFATIPDAWFRTTEPQELSWNIDYEYRIARPMVSRIVTYPEPLRVKPKFGAKYWWPRASESTPVSYIWHNEPIDNRIFDAGMAFATEADAAEAHRALFGGGQ